MVPLEAQSYGRPVIGRPDVIQGLTREQLLGFYRRYYVPPACYKYSYSSGRRLECELW